LPSRAGSRKKLLRRHLAQRRTLYARAVNNGELRTALAVARDEAELLGLYPARQIKAEHSGLPVKVYLGVDPQELLAAPATADAAEAGNNGRCQK
jgi:hypothetical protein